MSQHEFHWNEPPDLAAESARSAEAEQLDELRGQYRILADEAVAALEQAVFSSPSAAKWPVEHRRGGSKEAEGEHHGIIANRILSFDDCGPTEIDQHVVVLSYGGDDDSYRIIIDLEVDEEHASGNGTNRDLSTIHEYNVLSDGTIWRVITPCFIEPHQGGLIIHEKYAYSQLNWRDFDLESLWSGVAHFTDVMLLLKQIKDGELSVQQPL